MGIMVVAKILITILIQLEFWDKVRDLILAPIKDPKVATTVVLLVIPFFVNVSLSYSFHETTSFNFSFIFQVMMFWVTDNFLMKKPRRTVGRKHAVRYQRVNQNPINPQAEDSDVLISGDEEFLDSEPSTPVAFKNAEELLNINRRNNSVV